jgi:hypothetical protein
MSYELFLLSAFRAWRDALGIPDPQEERAAIERYFAELEEEEAAKARSAADAGELDRAA